MKIREATLKDLDRIHSLNMKLIGESYRVMKLKNPKSMEKFYYKYYEKMLRNKNSVFFVAEYQKKIVGFVFGEVETSKKFTSMKKVETLH